MPVGADDVAALAALRRAWVQELAGTTIEDPAYGRAFVSWWGAESDRRLCWLARRDGEPVGMLSMVVFRRMPKPGRPLSRWGYISNVFVLAAHRQAGIGRDLLQMALDRARTEDYARVVLAPSERSLPFYARAGFRPADDLLVHPMGSP